MKNTRKTKRPTNRQKKFARCYNGNNPVEACRKAGYKGSKAVLSVRATKLLNNPKIFALIEQREKKRMEAAPDDTTIAEVEEAQRFFTATMRGEYEKADMKDRIKAAELLVKSQAGFTDVRLTVNADFKAMLISAHQRLELGTNQTG